MWTVSKNQHKQQITGCSVLTISDNKSNMDRNCKIAVFRNKKKEK